MPWVMLIWLVCNDCYSLIASNHLIRPPHRGGVRSNTCSLSISAWEGMKPCGESEACFWKRDQNHIFGDVLWEAFEPGSLCPGEGCETLTTLIEHCFLRLPAFLPHLTTYLVLGTSLALFSRLPPFRCLARLSPVCVMALLYFKKKKKTCL